MAHTASFRLARIRGVELKLHVSLLLLLLYIVIVASVQLPFVAAAAGIDVNDLNGGPVAWGIVFAVALLVSVAIHEFAHAFTAQALGMKVRGITLMMLGGVSEMEKIPERPYSEFKLAIVGPLMSFLLAAAMIWLGSRATSPDLALFGYWLGRANLTLAVFNLLPAFPLDGGRALRSILAARLKAKSRGKSLGNSEDVMLRATRIAVAISKVLAWVFGILGFLTLNLVLMLIAFFVYTAAQSELYLVMGRSILSGLTAGEVAIRTGLISDGTSLSQVAEEMQRTRNSVLPVKTEKGGAALVFLDSLTRVARELWPTTQVREVMVGVARPLKASESIAEALPELASAYERALPVEHEGEVVGVVRLSDLTNVIQLRSLRPEEGVGRKAA